MFNHLDQTVFIDDDDDDDDGDSNQLLKGAVSRNSAKLGNYKMPVKLRET